MRRGYTYTRGRAVFVPDHSAAGEARKSIMSRLLACFAVLVVISAVTARPAQIDNNARQERVRTSYISVHLLQLQVEKGQDGYGC